ncbi:MAG: RNA polymerase sigma factor [Prolixibacteraceae bacterium]|jgi:RNA polymerase sigma factor (sigma-70 family)|nr:RNA polymerase sigma factor [Prolixibacteraceae bacterium]
MDEDKFFIEKILAGDVNQFKVLVEKYQNPVFKVVQRIVNNYDDAREVTQDVFVKTFESLNQYKVQYKFFSWIYRIAINHALMFVKSKKQFSSLDELPNAYTSKSENTIDQEKRDQLLYEQINELPERYKTVILLKYYAKLSYEEISETLEIDTKKVRSRLFDARKKLKNKLQDLNFFTAIQ